MQHIVCDSPSHNSRCANLLAGGHVLATEQAGEHLGGRATHRLQIRDHGVRQCRSAMPSVSRTCEGPPPALPFAFYCSTARGAAHAYAALLVCCCACRSSITSSTTHQHSPERSATPSGITRWACINLHCGVSPTLTFSLFHCVFPTQLTDEMDKLHVYRRVSMEIKTYVQNLPSVLGL